MCSNGGHVGIHSNSLCWDCQNAVLGCEWSREFEPVPGWTAKPRRMIDNARGTVTMSYNVIKCPKFIKDEPPKKVLKKKDAEKKQRDVMEVEFIVAGGQKMTSVGRMTEYIITERTKDNELTYYSTYCKLIRKIKNRNGGEFELCGIKFRFQRYLNGKKLEYDKEKKCPNIGRRVRCIEIHRSFETYSACAMWIAEQDGGHPLYYTKMISVGFKRSGGQPIRINRWTLRALD